MPVVAVFNFRGLAYEVHATPSREGDLVEVVVAGSEPARGSRPFEAYLVPKADRLEALMRGDPDPLYAMVTLARDEYLQGLRERERRHGESSCE